jgi:hypothetical protein
MNPCPRLIQSDGTLAGLAVSASLRAKRAVRVAISASGASDE